MFRFVLSLLIILPAPRLYAAEISGTISSEKDKIVFARIYLPELKKGAHSNSEGRYIIRDVPEGKYQVIVSAEGFISDTAEIIIPPNVERVEYNCTLKEGIQELSEVTVNALQRETILSESPITISIVSPKLFEKNPTPSIFEAIGMVNGVRPQLQCNVCSTGDIHINGMEGPYTMVMIDGMPIVSALGTVYGLMGIPNSIIERVEIQKGPSGVLYGSEAVGGLINVITKRPENAPKFSFGAVGTSYQDINLDLSYRFKLGNRVSGLFGANSFLFDKRWDINNDNFTDVTLQKRIALFGKLSVGHKNGNSSSIAARYLYEDRWGGEMSWTPDFRGGDSIYGESIYTSRYELIGTTPLFESEDQLKLQYSFIAHQQNSVYGNTFFAGDQYIGFAQLLKELLVERHAFLFGLTTRYTHYDDNTVITERHLDSTTIINLPSKTWLPGIFVQDELRINEKNTILAGLRYDYNSDHGHILSPRFNWKSELSKHHTLRFGVGNGYRVVNLFSEDHAAFNGAREVVITEDLKPERSWNTNLNYSLNTSAKWIRMNLELNGFYNYFSNKIVADYFTDVEKVIFENLRGYGICRGVGAEMNLGFNFPLKATLGATFSDVFLMEEDSTLQLVSGEQVHTPKLTGNVVLSYTFCKLNTTIDLTGNIYSPMLLPVFENDYRPSRSPWFGIFNIQVTTLLNDRWQLNGGVKNLFDYIPSQDPIMRPFDPFDKYADDPVNNPNGYTFDPGYNYAPYQRIRAFLGVKYTVK